jgi:flagellar motor protein MotB
VVLCAGMTKDPFSSSVPRKFTAGRIALGLLVVGFLTFVFGFYLPLSDAHSLLAKEHRSLSEAANGTKTQLEKTTEQLLAAQGERDELQTSIRKVEEERAATKATLETLTQTIENKLASSIKAKVVVVEPAADRVTLLVDETRVFRPSEVQPHRPGQTLLCTVAKALKDVEAEYAVGATTPSEKVTDAVLKRNYPTAWELTAARAAGAAKAMTQCGLSAKATRAVGLGHAHVGSDAERQATGELRITLTPRSKS